MKYVFFLLFALMVSWAKADSFEKRQQEIARQVLCPSCQGQSIAESSSPIAVKMREEVNDLLRKRKTDEQIYTFLADTYGQEVLLKPLVAWHTFVLWFFPFALLFLIGLHLGKKRGFL